ncbi:FK506-binding protein 15 [Mactra antiquata]
MFFDKDDEDTDFLNPGGSKLGALFGMDKAGNQGGNESLTYTAPKQPKKKESTPPAKGAPSVAFAIAVHAYKYVDGKYASQGKLGAAILANHGASEYSILMYVSQQQKVTTAKITSAFSYTCQANNYANFYDDTRQSWSVLFDNEQNAIDFAKHICLAKALSTGPTPTCLVPQDLVAGDGGQLETGDSVEVKYTGWLLTNNTFGQVFDSNAKADKLFRFKLGAGKVIKGWDTGVVGMKKGGKRFMVVPSSLAYGSQGMANRIPANATLLFEIEVVRVKLVGRDSSPAPTQAPPQPVQAPPTSTQGEGDGFDDDDNTVKERTRSISDQLSHSPPADTSKAKLISRMAKMGKPMLPLGGAVAAGPDSEEENVAEPTVQQTPKEVPTQMPQAVPTGAVPVASQQQQQQQPMQPVYQVTSVQNTVPSQPAFLQNLPGAQQMAVYQPQQQQQNFLQQQQANMMQGGYQSQIYTNQTQQAVPGSTIPPYLVSGMSQGTDMMLLSETRQQNTELRLTLSKVSDKVDTVLQKIDQGQNPNTGTAMLPNMETSVLLHNITRIVQENERLKKDVFDKSGKIETQNEKISELLQRNQSFVEKSQVLMEQRNEGLLSSANQTQHRVLSLEQEKVELTKQLSEATSQISALQLDVSGLKKKEFELSQQLESGSKMSRKQTEELETLKTQHTDDESMIIELQKQLKEEKQNRKSMESKVTQIQEEMSDIEDAKRAVEKSLSDRKRKSAEERRQLEDELEDVKANFEAEIQSLKDKLRKQKTSASAANQEQISQIEDDINKDWQSKHDRLMAVATEKHNRALSAVTEEKQELEAKIQQLENKLHTLRQGNSSTDDKINELQEQVEQLSVWKDKYESLRNTATTMKEKYEEQIEELEEERDNLTEKLQSGHGGAAGGAEPGAGNLLEEVKKIMNTVYKEMREAFESDEKYTGSEILAVILNSIKRTTLSLVSRSKEENVAADDDDDDDDDDDESDDEEEESDEEAEDEDEEEEDEEEETKETIEDAKQVVAIETEKPVEKPAVEQTDEMSDSEEDDDDDDENDEQNTSKDGSKDDSVTDETKSEQVKNTDDEKGDDTKIAQNDDTEKEEDVVEETSPNTQKSEDVDPLTVISNTTESSMKKAGSLEDLLDSALESKPSKKNKEKTLSTTPIVSMEPPPLSEESSDDQDVKSRTKSIFADDDDDDDDNVADTLGISSKPAVNGEPVKNKTTEKQSTVDEDLKPKPPPPLFGDDDDDDDLDWLS